MGNQESKKQPERQLVRTIPWHKLYSKTWAGDDEGTINSPDSICLTKDGRVIIGESLNSRIQVFDSNCFIRAIGGKGRGRLKLKGDVKFSYPSDVCAGKNEHGNLILVTDMSNRRVHVFTLKGAIVHSFICPDDPYHVCVDGKTNDVYVSSWTSPIYDAMERRIYVFSWGETRPTRVIGAEGYKPGELGFPARLYFHDELGQLFVVDRNSPRLFVLTPDGHLIHTIDLSRSREDVRLHGFCFDVTGTFFAVGFCAFHAYGIDVYEWDGKKETFVRSFGKWGSGPGEFFCHGGMCVDAQNYLMVADEFNHRIQIVDVFPLRRNVRTVQNE